MTTREIHDLLAAHDFFSGLAPADLELVAGCGVNRAYRAGEALMREGDPADEFFVIREGRVAIEIDTPSRGALVIETLGPNEVLGWSWLIPPYRYAFDARARTTTRAVSLDGACLRGKCEEDPRFGYELVRRFAAIIARRLEASRLRLLDLYGVGDDA